MSLAITTICFDMDGTLVDTAPDLVGAMNYVLSRNGFDTVEYGIAKTMIGQGAAAMIKGGLATLGQTVQDAQLAEMERAFGQYYLRNYATSSKVFDGAEQALDELRKSGCTLAVCSNTGEELVKTILGEFDLLCKFSTICGGDTTPHKKPDPRSLLHAIRQSNGSPSESVMVGDAETDIEAAKRASVPVVAFDFGYSKTPVDQLDPDAVISSYSQLCDTVSSILSRSCSA